MPGLNDRTQVCECTDLLQFSNLRLLLLISLGLQTFGIITKTWFSFHINIEDCVQCGPLTVAIGDAFDKSAATNFTIQDYVRVYAGIWGTSVCTPNHLCLDMGLCEAQDQYEFFPVINRAIVSLRIGAVFLKLSYVITFMSFISTFDRTMNVTFMIWLPLLSGILSFSSAFVTTSMYLLSMREFEIFHTQVCLPLAALAVSTAAYILFYCAYKIWKIRTCQCKYLVLDSSFWKQRRKYSSL